MEISGSSIAERNKNIHQQILDRKISPSDGASEYALIQQESYSHQTLNQTIAPGLPTVWGHLSLLSPDTFTQASQLVPNQIPPHDIMNAYTKNNGNHLGVNGISILGLAHNSISSFAQAINSDELADNPIHQFNLETHDFFMNYAAEHPNEWRQAAEDLNIDISGEAYATHFLERPDDVAFNFEEGDAKSIGELIFRHIATENEIAQFDHMLTSAQTKLDDTAYAMLETFWANNLSQYEGASDSEFKVMKFHELIQEEGISIPPNQPLSFGRNPDNTFYVKGNFPTKPALEEAINNNPDIYNLLNETWQKQTPTYSIEERQKMTLDLSFI